MGKEVNLKNVLRLGEERDSSTLLVQAVKLLKISKKNVWRKLTFMMLELFVAILLSISSTTLIRFATFLELLNGVLIAFFSVVFTGYALFQALVGERLLLYLVNETIDADGEEKSQLEDSNDYFAKVMLAQFILILLNIFCVMILNIVTDLNISCMLDFSQREWIGAVVIFILIHLNFEVLWEIKSFIFNVFQLFNGHAMARIIEMVEKEKEENRDCRECCKKKMSGK